MVHNPPPHWSWQSSMDALIGAAFTLSDAAWWLTKGDDDPDGDWDDRDIVDPGDAPWNWTFGAHKSMQKWENRMRTRGWTKEQITRTIAEGQEFPAINKVHPENPAVRYELDGKSVVRDEVTKEILAIGDKGFEWD